MNSGLHGTVPYFIEAPIHILTPGVTQATVLPTVSTYSTFQNIQKPWNIYPSDIQNVMLICCPFSGWLCVPVIKIVQKLYKKKHRKYDSLNKFTKFVVSIHG